MPNDPIGYGACVVRVQSTEQLYAASAPVVTGRIGELMPMDRRPEALRSCYVVRDLLAPPIPCRTWHLGEALATQIVSVTGMAAVVPAIRRPLAGDHAARQRRRGSSGWRDPTFGGRLRIAVDGRILQTTPTTTGGSLTVTGHRAAAVPRRDHRRSADRLGDRPRRPIPAPAVTSAAPMPSTPAAGLGRRMGGAVLLVTLVLAVVVIGAARRPATVGTATVAPFPDPPPVGSCLSRSGLGYVTVPCAEPHLVEVTRSWSGWEWDSRGVSGTGADQLCDLTAGSYLGKPGSIDGWNPIALPWLTVFASGPGEETGPWGWRACGVFPRAGEDQLDTPARLPRLTARRERDDRPARPSCGPATRLRALPG